MAGISLKGPYAVYRIYGPEGLPLYIGRSKNPRARMSSHRHHHRYGWWKLVRDHEVSWYPDFWTASPVETRELRRYRPICNPAFPDEGGGHTTVLKGHVPVRSLWAQVADVAKKGRQSVADLVMTILNKDLVPAELSGEARIQAVSDVVREALEREARESLPE